MICIGALAVHAKNVTDMAGRQVDIPDRVERVLPFDPKTSILIFPVLDEKMVATCVLTGKKGYRFIDDRYKNMPEVDVKNIEAVLAANPQVLLYGIYSNTDNTEPVLKLGRRLNIPVLLVNLSIDRLDEAYSFLGTVFAVEEKCKPLISFLQAVYTEVDSIMKLSPAIKTEVYYSLGQTGFMTDPSGSRHTEVFDYLNIPNAAKVDIPSGGHVKVNMEQVLFWNPEYIFTSNFMGENNAYSMITTDSKWKSIRAVKNYHVYKVPSQPMSWFDHPPSINRVPGLIWLCGLFYNVDARVTQAEITRFYSLFYNYQLSSAEYRTLFE
jgi:iron complex transport system substrate-binding protein